MVRGCSGMVRECGGMVRGCKAARCLVSHTMATLAVATLTMAPLNWLLLTTAHCLVSQIQTETIILVIGMYSSDEISL